MTTRIILFMAIFMVAYANANAYFNFGGVPLNNPFLMIHQNFPNFPNLFPQAHSVDVANRVPGPGEMFNSVSINSHSGSFIKDGKAEQTGGMTVMTNDNGVVKKYVVGDSPSESSIKKSLYNFSIPMPKLPNINIPMPKLPNIDIPMPKLPNIHIPMPKLPNIVIPIMPELPNINIPMPKIPDINIPLPQLPNINIPAPQLPNINITLPEIPANEPVKVLTMKAYNPNGQYYQQSMTYVGNGNGAGVASIFQNINGQVSEEVIDLK